NFLVYSENLTSVVYNAYSSPYGEYSFPTRRSSDLGLIHANAELGLLEVGSVRETNERTSSGEITASFDVAEGLDPSSVRIPVARAEGVTASLAAPAGGLFAGQAALIALSGERMEEVLRVRDAAMAANFADAPKEAGNGGLAPALARV